MTKKSGQNFKYLDNEKSFQETFFNIFKGLSLKQINKVFLKGKSPTLINFE